MRPDEVKKIRKAMGKTLAEFGLLLGMSAPTVLRKERGDSKIRKTENDALLRIAKENGIRV